jgi:hypothetical protein
MRRSAVRSASAARPWMPPQERPCEVGVEDATCPTARIRIDVLGGAYLHGVEIATVLQSFVLTGAGMIIDARVTLPKVEAVPGGADAHDMATLQIRRRGASEPAVAPPGVPAVRRTGMRVHHTNGQNGIERATLIYGNLPSTGARQTLSTDCRDLSDFYAQVNNLRPPQQYLLPRAATRGGSHAGGRALWGVCVSPGAARPRAAAPPLQHSRAARHNQHHGRKG